jgi:hypothetical protein
VYATVPAVMLSLVIDVVHAVVPIIARPSLVFTALVLFLVAIAFRDAAGYFGNDTLVWCLDMTYCVFLVGGILTLWQALRLTAESARSYFRSSTDPRAQEWARVALIAFVLRRI